MKAQWENKIMSSMLQFVDNEILTHGEAFTNYGSSFYKTADLYNGYYTYSSPFKQFVGDTSIINANVLTGVYINNTWTELGQEMLKELIIIKGKFILM